MGGAWVAVRHTAERYVSAEVDTEISATKTDFLDFDKNLRLERKSVFLQTIIKGRFGLYFYKDKSDKENFYFEEDEKFRCNALAPSLPNSERVCTKMHLYTNMRKLLEDEHI